VIQKTLVLPALAPSQTQTLQDVVLRVGAWLGKGLHPVVLMDLDDTLLSTSFRHIRIMNEFVKQPHIGARFPRESQIALNPSLSKILYSITDTAKNLGVENEAFLNDLRAFWFKRFFKNAYILEDQPIEGAPKYCWRLIKSGAILVYLTGRDETMRQGSLQSLRQHEFPLPNDGNVQLILKPAFETPDLDFKVAALRSASALGEVAAGFENEPGHINLFQETFPQGLMVFVDSRHSGKPIKPCSSVRWIKNFL